VDGDARNIKVTTDRDRDLALALAALQDDNVMPVVRIGIGYDSHRLVTGRPLVLGGVRIPFDQGLAGHSDADAIAHAVTDAVLGAASMGDIGQLFPDTDPRWKDADSLALLTAAVARARAGGFRVGNVDVTVVAERPKLAPWRDAIRANLARALGCTPAQVSVKGKTNEGLDAIGRGEGVAVHAVALLMRA
jgi:2-C-methyl-D-erythritol 4-phosphate cytidylyltransferase/2-C-methyl-D-erythritol 2,4-cyclodiphosphate synthase